MHGSGSQQREKGMRRGYVHKEKSLQQGEAETEKRTEYQRMVDGDFDIGKEPLSVLAEKQIFGSFLDECDTEENKQSLKRKRLSESEEDGSEESLTRNGKQAHREQFENKREACSESAEENDDDEGHILKMSNA